MPRRAVATERRSPRSQPSLSRPRIVEAAIDMADAEGHHPSITTEWGRVTIRWWTHKIAGLHKNDFIMAAKTDTVEGSSKP